MSNDNKLERTSLMTITIEVENGGVSTRSFKLYPGTEMVYGQGVDLAVTTALGKISKSAYEIISGADDIPENVAIEAVFGAAVQGAED